MDASAGAEAPGRHRGKTTPSGGRETQEVSERGGPIFPPGRPKEKTAPSEGRELREASERGGSIFPPGRPKEKYAPSGGRALLLPTADIRIFAVAAALPVGTQRHHILSLIHI